MKILNNTSSGRVLYKDLAYVSLQFDGEVAVTSLGMKFSSPPTDDQEQFGFTDCERFQV